MTKTYRPQIRQIASTGERLFALGSDGAVWFSVRGEEWAKLPLLPEQEVPAMPPRPAPLPASSGFVSGYSPEPPTTPMKPPRGKSGVPATKGRWW